MIEFIIANVTSALLFMVTVTVLLALYVSTLPSLRNMPPGPFPIPVFGNFWMLLIPGATIMSVLGRLRDKYGKLYTFQMGSKTFVFINDLRLVQEAFIKRSDITSERPNNVQGVKKFKETVGLGVALNNGQAWKELRKVSMAAMRELGVGKKSLEEKIMDEITVVRGFVEKAKGEPMFIKPLLVKATSNVIAGIMFGTRFEYEDPTFINFLQRLEEAFKVNPIFTPSNFLPGVKYFLEPEKGFIKTISILMDHIKGLIEDHEETFDADNIRDFVDLTLQMRQTDSNRRHFDDHNMRRVISDIFLAGAETTAATLQWLFYFMAAYPDIQQKCQKEIDEVLGDGRQVSIVDKPTLPYTEAVILEVLRMIPIVPFSFPREVKEDFQLNGYNIPKGTFMMASIVASNYDPTNFDNPEQFEPSRWIGENGEVKGRDRILTFSVGPRSCLGELAAKHQLFLFFTSILQYYTVCPETADTIIDLSEKFVTVNQGNDQNLVLKKRGRVVL